MCAALPLAMAAEPVYPPWQHGENNPALNKGLEFTVPDADNLADFHGNLNDPLLVLYCGYFASKAFINGAIVKKELPP